MCGVILKCLHNLEFIKKQSILRNLVTKVVGTKSQLQINGYLPININVFTRNRHRRASQRGQVHTF